MILLMDEFAELTPPGIDADEWKKELREIADTLTKACRQVDPASTDLSIQKAHQVVDVVVGEKDSGVSIQDSEKSEEVIDNFAAGLIEE